MKMLHVLTGVIIITLDYLWELTVNMLLGACAILFAFGINGIIDALFLKTVSGTVSRLTDVCLAVFIVVTLATTISFFSRLIHKRSIK